MTRKFSLLLILSFSLLLASCSKESSETNTIEEEQENPVVVDCDLILDLIAENGDISAIVTGGTVPYSYEWSSGETEAMIRPTATGEYVVEVTDAEGCIIIGVQAITVTQTDCDEFEGRVGTDATGSILTTHVTNGTAPFTYEWSTGETTETITITEGGTYEVLITDAEGCRVALQIVIEFNDNCADFTGRMYEDSGLILLYVEGGTAPYAYLWSTGEVTSSITPASEGIFLVTVTDSEGCALELELDYMGNNSDDCDNFVLDTVYDQAQVTLTANTSGGTNPITYSWSTGETTQTISVVSGTYEIYVTDANGCLIRQIIQIP